MRTKADQEVAAVKAEKESWRERFVESQLNDSLRAAVNQTDAHDTLIDVLKPKTHLVEIKDTAGNPSGKYEARVDWPGTDPSTGQPTVTQLTPTEVGAPYAGAEQLSAHVQVGPGWGNRFWQQFDGCHRHGGYSGCAFTNPGAVHGPPEVEPPGGGVTVAGWEAARNYVRSVARGREGGQFRGERGPGSAVA